MHNFVGMINLNKTLPCAACSAAIHLLCDLNHFIQFYRSWFLSFSRKWRENICASCAMFQNAIEIITKMFFSIKSSFFTLRLSSPSSFPDAFVCDIRAMVLSRDRTLCITTIYREVPLRFFYSSFLTFIAFLLLRLRNWLDPFLLRFCFEFCAFAPRFFRQSAMDSYIRNAVVKSDTTNGNSELIFRYFYCFHHDTLLLSAVLWHIPLLSMLAEREGIKCFWMNSFVPFCVLYAIYTHWCNRRRKNGRKMLKENYREVWR